MVLGPRQGCLSWGLWPLYSEHPSPMDSGDQTRSAHKCPSEKILAYTPTPRPLCPSELLFQPSWPGMSHECPIVHFWARSDRKCSLPGAHPTLTPQQSPDRALYLAHEGGDHTVEGGALVAEALLTRAQGSEVFWGTGQVVIGYRQAWGRPPPT